MNAVTPSDLKDKLREKLASGASAQAERLLVEIEDAEAQQADAVADVAEPAPGPAPAAAPEAPQPAPQPRATPRRPQPRAASAVVPAQLAGVEVTLTVEVGSHSLTLQDLVNIEPGQLFALDRMTDEPVTILVNGQPFAEGEVVALDDRFGVRILAILPAGGD